MTFKRETNPENLAVQLNVKVPWWLRELTFAEANDRGISQSQLVKEILEKALASRIKTTLDGQTRQAGATK